mmetsp:Transcript_38363/g.62177  ORF Transcript_38363/g.62177 Transcript_38363/m.62177 type:complete len:254 (+) Transcript_38363:1487-2248(+)
MVPVPPVVGIRSVPLVHNPFQYCRKQRLVPSCTLWAFAHPYPHLQPHTFANPQSHQDSHSHRYTLSNPHPDTDVHKDTNTNHGDVPQQQQQNQNQDKDIHSDKDQDQYENTAEDIVSHSSTQKPSQNSSICAITITNAATDSDTNKVSEWLEHCVSLLYKIFFFSNVDARWAGQKHFDIRIRGLTVQPTPQQQHWSWSAGARCGLGVCPLWRSCGWSFHSTRKACAEGKGPCDVPDYTCSVTSNISQSHIDPL